MTMDAIRKVTEIEEKGRAEKAEAEARVKQALSEAEREGAAQLQKARRDAAEKGNTRAGLAVDMFNYGVKKYIGAYAAAMGGVDAIIFTAGVGENSADQRMAIASGLEFMGVKMDEDANKVRGEERVISAADSKVKVLLIPTNEELMIAMDTASLVK